MEVKKAALRQLGKQGVELKAWGRKLGRSHLQLSKKLFGKSAGRCVQYPIGSSAVKTDHLSCGSRRLSHCFCSMHFITQPTNWTELHKF